MRNPYKEPPSDLVIVSTLLWLLLNLALTGAGMINLVASAYFGTGWWVHDPLVAYIVVPAVSWLFWSCWMEAISA